MRYAFLGLFLAFFCKNLCAQELIYTPLPSLFCKPGVTNKAPSKGLLIEYGAYPNYHLTTRLNGENQQSQVDNNSFLNIKLKAPLINKSGLKVLVGVAHLRENYDFRSIDPSADFLFNGINDNVLKTTRIGLYILKPINSRLYTSFKFETSQNGDYDKLFNFDKRYAIYRGIGMVGFKPNANREWGVGVMARTGFRKSALPVLPFAFYNQTFNDKWGIELAIPVSMKVRYNVNDKNIFMMGSEFNSRSYSLDLQDDSNSIFHARTSRVDLSLEYLRQVSPWVWFSIKGGYAHNFTSRFENASMNTSNLPELIEANPSGGPFFKIGVFVSPSKKAMK